MKFPVRIRKEMDEYILDAVPAFTLSLNYKILDTIRGKSIDEVVRQTRTLICETINRFVVQGEYFALPRNLSVYINSDLRFVEEDKTWTTVDIELENLSLDTQATHVVLPVTIIEKLQQMADTLNSSPDMLLTVLLAQLQPDQHQK